jgi:DUF4097 and DUF4098 domain-containing protein YvlB
MSIRSLCICTLCASLLVANSTVAQKLSLKKVSGFIGAKPFEEVIERSYDFPEFGTLAVKTMNGSITVRSAWKNNKVQLRATKHASSEDELDEITIDDTARTAKQLTLATRYTGSKHRQGSIDYVLMIPHNTHIRLETDSGTIKVSNTSGALHATTVNGDIEAESIQGSVTATSKRSGAITLTAIKGTLTASTHRGAITITDAHNAIKAHSKTGKITINAPRLSPHSPIDVTSHSGSIALNIPSNSDIRLHASTDRGTVTTTCPLTLDPVTTALDTSSWQNMQKEVSGIMGAGTTRVTLNTDNGNIRVNGMKMTA